MEIDLQEETVYIFLDDDPSLIHVVLFTYGFIVSDECFVFEGQDEKILHRLILPLWDKEVIG